MSEDETTEPESQDLELTGAEAAAYLEYRAALRAFRSAERAAEKILRPAQERFQAAVASLNQANQASEKR